MIKVRVSARAKGQSAAQGGSSHPVISQGQQSWTHADTADRAAEADRARFADYADRADTAAHATEAEHARIADLALDIDPSADRWLHRDRPDSTPHRLGAGELEVGGLTVAGGGVRFGADFAPGIAGGVGGLIDGHGAAELESLVLRRFLEVPELRYNRVSVEAGNSWRSPGGGVVRSCVPDIGADGSTLPTGTVTLHLEDGEIGTVAADDICMGVFHSASGTAANSAMTSDDSMGNFRFAGFQTVYFRITEILEKGRNSVFRYALRPASERWAHTHHPCEAMHFAGYGNFSDKDRQTSRYSTRTYERYLREVSDWEFGAANIAAQFGDLTNLSVFGMAMDGYSAYLSNIYMTGTIQQLEAIHPRMEIGTDGDQFLAYGESTTVRCRVFRGWEDVTESVTAWTVARDSGDPAEDAAWALKPKVKSFGGELEICFTPDENDLGTNSRVLSTVFTFRADLGGGQDAASTLTI